ncbi:hypothetical protein ACSBR2_017248 [Camellia fascicularis]
MGPKRLPYSSWGRPNLVCFAKSSHSIPKLLIPRGVILARGPRAARSPPAARGGSGPLRPEAKPSSMPWAMAWAIVLKPGPLARSRPSPKAWPKARPEARPVLKEKRIPNPRGVWVAWMDACSMAAFQEVMLLEKAYDEFGFEQRDGLVVPCSVAAFQEVVSAVQRR